MTKHQLCQYIVSNFCDIQKKLWGREIKIAKKLIEQYPDPEFWKSIPKYKYTTLAFFLTENGKKELVKRKEIKKINIESKENIEISEEKVDNDVEFKPSTNTLLDFLRKK